MRKAHFTLQSGAFVYGLIAGLLAIASSAGHLDEAVALATAKPMAAEPTGKVRETQLPTGGRLSLSADGTFLLVRGPNSSGEGEELRLPEARLAASLTSLPSGRILIWGGADEFGRLHRDGLWFDPRLRSLKPAKSLTLSPRAAHTATVLTDGRVLFAGGDQNLAAELWEERNDEALVLSDESVIDRRNASARLLADGRVEISGGFDASGRVASGALIFDKAEGRFSRSVRGVDHFDSHKILGGSIPESGETDVSPDARLAIRLARPIHVDDSISDSVTLIGVEGSVPASVVAAEAGRLLFIKPSRSLFPGSRYTLMIDGVRSLGGGNALPVISVDFRTAQVSGSVQEAGSGQAVEEEFSAAIRVSTGGGGDGCDPVQYHLVPCRPHGLVKDGVWYPGQDNTKGRWRIAGPELDLYPDSQLARITSIANVTGIRGRVVRLDQTPIGNVAVTLGDKTTRTTEEGWFLLFDVPDGHQELYVDGSAANRDGEEYGRFVAGIQLEQGKLNEVPYLMHLPRITARDKIKISSPLSNDMIVGHPDLPGLELHIPKGTVIHDREGRLVTEISIVPIPVNRAPFPVMENHPMAFTIEPGGAQVRGLDPKKNGIRVYYPNYDQFDAGTEANFWVYDPGDGWRIYGKGAVSQDGRHFVPGSGVALHQTMGGMFSVPENNAPSEPGLAPDNSGECGCSGDAAVAGDPIDLRTGEFTHAEIDVAIEDVVPLVISRSYRPNDIERREFGVGMSWNWGYTLHRPEPSYDVLDLVLPNGSSLPFHRISGNGSQGAWRQPGSNTRFSGAELKSVYDADPNQPWGRAFLLTLRDGSRMQFSSFGDIRIRWIEDKYGNRTSLFYKAGLVSSIVSPSGRSVSLDYDSNGRVQTVRDHTGRQWQYVYNGEGLLAQVTYPDSTSKKYGYQTRRQDRSLVYHRIESIIDQRNHRLLLNEFEVVDGVSTGRVVKQTQADGGEITIDYEHIDAGVTGTLVQEPDGSQRWVVFDSSTPYPKLEVYAYGTSEAQVFTYERDNYGRLIEAVDPLGRKTEYDYNVQGQLETLTVLAGTQMARRVTMTYTGNGDLESFTDPLGRATRFTYVNRCLASVEDALGRVTKFECDSAGRVLAVTDPLHQVRVIHYEGFDLAGVTDPLGRGIWFRHDSLGRLVAFQDGAGNITRREFDVMDRQQRIVDANGNVTEFGFDANGNLAAILLPNESGFTYTYDERNRLSTRVDALGRMEAWTYDKMDRVKSHTDRLQQITLYDYDAVGRLTKTTYNDGGTTTATYDDGNRLLALTDTEIDRSLSWEYDDFDDVIEASAPHGSIGYEYDAVGRRTKMRAAAQPVVSYLYDDGDRLLRIAQGNETVSFDYETADRPRLITLPNGVQVGHSYNQAGQLTGLAWQKPGDVALGSLGYGYDERGLLVAQTGSFASQVLPPASTGANRFDDANQQVGFDGRTLTYDANGNMVSDSVRSYRWNARNQLVEITKDGATVAAFSYDALGRRYSRSEGGATIHYLYDDADVVQEMGAGGSNPILTGLGVDERFGRNDESGRVYFLTDHLGSTRALTDEAGNLVRRYDYTPYGQTQVSGGRAGNPYQFTGRELDQSGLYYYRARYYDPQMGRFISEDPLQFLAGDTNFYAYVHGAPTEFTDPSGQFAVPGMLIGAGVDLAIQLALNGGDLSCVNWLEVGISGALGAVGGGVLAGTFRHSKSGRSWGELSQKWSNAGRRIRNAQGIKKGYDLHHWLIERNSWFGKRVPDVIKNHPWNLSPVSKTRHIKLHKMDRLTRTVAGSPTWARSAGASVGVGGGMQVAGDSCGCTN